MFLRWHLVLTCLLMSVSSISCSKKALRENAGDKQLTIAVIPKGTTHEFWKAIHAGAERAGKELGVEVIWKGPLKEDDREAQIKVVEDFISRGVSGIVLAPLDDTALRMPVREAVRAGINVVVIDSALQGNEHVSFVATDNTVAGAKAGRHLAELLKGKGKVVMLRYMEGSASTMEREQGFSQAISAYPGIEVVSDKLHGGATTESSYAASENLLAPFRTAEGGIRIDGIFCPNESTTFGMLRALQDAGLAGKVFFVGFDSSEKLLQALTAKQIHGLILQDPEKMGYLGVKTVVQSLQKKPFDAKIDTGSYLVTAENRHEPFIQSLINPVLGKGLTP
jgi:ribose transport system substrate-binding protein